MNRDNVIRACGNLPNAEHIDLVIKMFRRDPRPWFDFGYLTKDPTWGDADADIYLSICDSDRYKTYASILTHSTRGLSLFFSTKDVFWGALSALIAYDDCAHLLYSDPEEVKLLAALGSKTAAVLFPACSILNNITAPSV